MVSIKYQVRSIAVMLLMLIGMGQSLSQTRKCFGSCMGTTQVEPALNIAIDTVKAADYTDNIGPYTQIVIGNEPMHLIPGHHAGEISGFLSQMANDGFTTVDVVRFSAGGYLVRGRSNSKKCEEETRCNLAGGGKRLGKMKTNRNRDKEGCEWAKGGKRLKPMKTNRNRDNEGCEWAKGGKRKPKPKRLSPEREGCESAVKPKRLKSKRPEKRQNKTCFETSGKTKRKARPARQKNQGCEIRYFGKPGGKHRRR